MLRRLKRSTQQTAIEVANQVISRWPALGRHLATSTGAAALRALRESEERYRRLVETCPDAITLTDLRARLVTVNEQAAHLHGFASTEEMLASGLTAFDLIAPEDRDRASINAQKTLNEGSVRGVRYTLLRRDGSRLPVELSASLLLDGEGEPHGFIGVVRDMTEQQELVAAKQALNLRLLTAQEAERLRLARELHDGVGQMLAILGMEADWLLGHVEEGGEVHRVATRLREKVAETLASVRQMSYALRPAVLDDLGVGCALETLIEEINHHGAVHCEGHCEDVPNVPPEVATAIYRIAQEALSNVLRHAGATRAWLRLAPQDRLLRLTVEDDGRGISPEQLRSPRSLGLANMRARAVQLGGTLEIEARAPRGTRVLAEISTR
jgi:PAS domain S-box-containing protein